MSEMEPRPMDLEAVAQEKSQVESESPETVLEEARAAFIEVAIQEGELNNAVKERLGKFHDALQEVADATQTQGLRDPWYMKERVKAYHEAGLPEVMDVIDDALEEVMMYPNTGAPDFDPEQFAEYKHWFQNFGNESGS